MNNDPLWDPAHWVRVHEVWIEEIAAALDARDVDRLATLVRNAEDAVRTSRAIRANHLFEEGL